jgi:hypothetical protein
MATGHLYEPRARYRAADGDCWTPVGQEKRRAKFNVTRLFLRGLKRRMVQKRVSLEPNSALWKASELRPCSTRGQGVGVPLFEKGLRRLPSMLTSSQGSKHMTCAAQLGGSAFD